MARVIAVLLVALGLTGCYIPNQEHFDSYAMGLVRPRSALPAVETTLTSAGFSCDTRSSYPEVTCTRNRTAFMSGCIERINLVLDSARTSVTAVQPRPVLCTGL